MTYEVETFEINGVPIKVADMIARKHADTLDTKINTLEGKVVKKTDIVDNLLSEDSEKVLSAKQGYLLDQKVDECFQSVSNGKMLIAEAITDKGVETSATDTFQTMADNIEAIPSGRGDITVMEYTDTMYIRFEEIEVV